MVVFNIDVKIKENGGSKAVKSGIQQIQKTADKTQKVVERIGRRVRFNGIKRANKELEKTNKLAKTAKRILTQAFGALGIGLAVRELIQLSDVYQNFQNRLKLVTAGTENLNEVTKELFKTANETRSAYSATAELFTRVSIATKNLGRSQAEVINFTKTLNKAVILSGTTAAEAKNGIIQLSQGLASGALRGDELRSVLEQLPAVADAIAKSMNITRGQLREMGEAGKISADVIIDAMAKASTQIDKDFATTIPTISQAWTVLTNEVVRAIGEFNTASGAAQGVAAVIIALSKHVGTMATAVVLGGLAWAGLALQAHLAAAALARASAAAAGAAVSSAPLIAAFVAIAVATQFATSAIADYYDEVSDREAKEKGKSAKTIATERIQVLIKELDKFRRQMARTGGDTTVLEKRIAQLNHSLAIQKDRYNAATGGVRTYVQEKAKASAKTDEIVKRLADEAKALQDLEVDRRIGLQTLKEVRKVEKASGIDDAKDNDGKNKARIQSQLELTQAAREYRKVIDSVREPQEAFENQLIALSEAKKQGAISQSEFTLELIKLQNLPDFDLGGKFGGEALNANIDLMREKFGALNLTLEQETEIIGTMAAKGVMGLDTLAQGAAALKARMDEGTLEADEYKVALDELLGSTPDEIYKEEIADLNLLLKEGRISQTEWNEEARKLGPVGQKAATTFSSGFSTAIKKMTDEANDLAAVGEKIANVFADTAVDAINSFVETGKFKFKDFAADLLKQIARIIVRLLIVKALSAVAGAATGGASDVVVAGVNAGVDASQETEARAGGGNIEAGRPYLVGEDGPETIVPNQSGTVIPAGRTAGEQAPPPEVNVHVTNVTDPDEVPAAIEAGEYDKQLVNAITRNRDIIKQGLQ